VVNWKTVRQIMQRNGWQCRLWHRPEDIVSLTNHFLTRYCDRQGKRIITQTQEQR
jgi:DNA-binding NtrC family response regulator